MYRIERSGQRETIAKVQNISGYHLVRKMFYSWVKKYQYRVNRRPLLMSALVFWGDKTMQKAFKSWKIFRQQSKAKRAQLRTFWCIKSMVIMIDNSSIYDKAIYPSQLFSCPVSRYNAKELELTVAVYDDLLLKRLFTHWKEYYHDLRNFKAKIAYSYIRRTFNVWKLYKDESKVLKKKHSVWLKNTNEKIVWRTFNALKDYVKQQIRLRKIYDSYTTSRNKERLLNSVQIWIQELSKKIDYQQKYEIASSHYSSILIKDCYKKLREYQAYKILVKEWYHSYFEYKDNTLLTSDNQAPAGKSCFMLYFN